MLSFGQQEGHLWATGVVICLGEVQICIWPS